MIFKFNRNLSLLLSGQLVSQVGDKFYLLALSFWVLKTTGSPAKMGIVLACSLFPALLLGFVSGAFVDRYNRKFIIVVTDILRGLIITFVAIAYLSGFLNFYIIILSQILLSVNAAFFDPAIPAVLPTIVPEDQLSKANSKTEFIHGISTVFGPVLGGVAVAALGYGFAFIFNGVSFLVSAFFESFLKLPRSKKPKRGGTGESDGGAPSIKREIIEGYRYILMDKGLVVLIGLIGIIHFFVGFFEVLVPVLADSLSGIGAGNLGYLQAAFGVGTLVMALILSIRNMDNRESRFLFSGVFLIGMGFVFIGLFYITGILSVVLYLPIIVLIGSSCILAWTCFKTIIQKRIDDHMMGRVFGVVSSVGNGAIPFAMMIYGFLLDSISFYYLAAVSGLILLVLSILSYRMYRGYTYVTQS